MRAYSTLCVHECLETGVYKKRKMLFERDGWEGKREASQGDRLWKVDSRVESFYTRLKKTIPPIRATARPAEHNHEQFKGDRRERRS